MAYIVNSDIIARVGAAAAVQLSADSGDTADAAVLDEVRLSTEGEVNGYLAKRYATPVDLSLHPELAATLKGFALDVAVYRLHLRRPPVAEDYRLARNAAIKWCEGVAEGKIVLPATTTPASSGADAPTIAWGSSSQNAATLRDL